MRSHRLKVAVSIGLIVLVYLAWPTSTSKWEVTPDGGETAADGAEPGAYANVLGIRLFGELDDTEVLESGASFNAAMEKAIYTTIDALGPLDRADSILAVEATDQLWWDSTAPIPYREIIIRRDLDIGGDHDPWLIPPG